MLLLARIRICCEINMVLFFLTCPSLVLFQSFTLRRTVTAKPTFASGPAANDKVSAILEKANAIRQVFNFPHALFSAFFFCCLLLFVYSLVPHYKILTFKKNQAVGSDDGEDDDTWSDT